MNNWTPFKHNWEENLRWDKNPTVIKINNI